MITDTFAHQAIASETDCPHDVDSHFVSDTEPQESESVCDHESKCKAICVTTSNVLSPDQSIKISGLNSNDWMTSPHLAHPDILSLELEKPPRP